MGDYEPERILFVFTNILLREKMRSQKHIVTKQTRKYIPWTHDTRSEVNRQSKGSLLIEAFNKPKFDFSFYSYYGSER